MKYSHDFCGQLCWICGGQIWGEGVFDDTPDGAGTTSYHADCHPYKAYYIPAAQLEVKKLKAVIEDFVRQGYAHPDEWETQWCNYCGEHWRSGEEEVHAFTCPVERGRNLLNAD